MQALQSIEALRNVVKFVRAKSEISGEPLPVVAYTGTVKLHGTSAAVRFNEDGSLTPQSRSRELSIGSDNYGFALFVKKNEALLREGMGENFVGTVYGEWIGKGIQLGVAVSELDRQFVIFAVSNSSYDDVQHEDLLNKVLPVTGLIGMPENIEALNNAGIWIIKQVPEYYVEIDFNDPDAIVEHLTDLTLQVEKECPWGALHGVSGTGEGIVWCPDDSFLPEEMWFKTKGLAHKVEGKKPKVEVEAEVLADRAELAAKLLPEWRLEQGLSHLREKGLSLEPKSIGEYIKWITADVLKEESDVLAANDVEWKSIAGMVTTSAKEYILNKINEKL